MKSKKIRRFFACMIVLSLLMPLPVPAMAEHFPEETIPEETVPEETVPEETVPEETIPEETVPEETIPEETIPEETVPEEAVPEETVPEETVPEETVPEETVPEETVPEETVPEETIPEETVPEETIPEETVSGETVPEIPFSREELLQYILSRLPRQQESGPGLYFGLLHAHTTISDGMETPENTFAYAAGIEGLDFFAVTDHSHSFDNHLQGQVGVDGSAVSADWAAGKAAAASVTNENFVGIYGYEMSWPILIQNGHIGVFATPGFQSWQQPGYDTYDGALARCYSALASVPGAIGQFNHPGSPYGDFQGFTAYSPEADRVMALLEVASGNGESYRYYVKALDLGWHVAPTYNLTSKGPWTGSARTAVYAQSLTEEGIYDALRSRRVYATEDGDLEIMYYLNGHFMGSHVELADMGETAGISVALTDPTDATLGTVEVITSGGTVAASDTLSENSGTLTFSLPARPGYYFLRIIQPDGDTAVTAPVWIDGEETLRITSLTCETEIPVQNQPITLAMELENGEEQDFSIDLLEILADGVPVAADETLSILPAKTTMTHSMTVSCDCVGATDLTLRILGTWKGEQILLESTIVVSFQQEKQVTAIAVDGSHGNAGLDQLTLLRKQAMESQIEMQVLTEAPSVQELKDFRFFLILAPSEPFSDIFLEAVQGFAADGGSLVVCGQGSDPTAAAQLNRLLDAVGSTMALNGDLVQDPVNNGGSPQQLYSDNITLSSPWCSGVTTSQVYRHVSGCSIRAGSGQPLVQGRDTTLSAGGEPVILLAAETLSGGGTVFAAGTLFCEDASMAEPQNIWDDVYANRTIARNLLGIGGEVLPLSTILQARRAVDGELLRIRGYVTAGTSNPYNTFPDTLYLQDDTGGIAVMPFSESGIQAGTALEITGYAMEKDGNRCLKLSSWKTLDADMYLYVGRTGEWENLLDPALCGGLLVQVEGTCLEVYAREDGTLAGCLLKNQENAIARVKIEDYISNGSDGENDLHKTIRRGRTVRAMGIVHYDEYGDAVIRVRDCEEVVWVPPLASLGLLNPDTGDHVLLPVLPMVLSLAGLLLLGKRKQRFFA